MYNGPSRSSNDKSDGQMFTTGARAAELAEIDYELDIDHGLDEDGESVISLLIRSIKNLRGDTVVTRIKGEARNDIMLWLNRRK